MADKHQHPQTNIIRQVQPVRIAVRNGFIRCIELPVQIRFRPLLCRTGQQLQMAVISIEILIQPELGFNLFHCQKHTQPSLLVVAFFSFAALLLFALIPRSANPA